MLAALKRSRRVSDLGSELDLLGTKRAKGECLLGESLAIELEIEIGDADDPRLIDNVGETGECEFESESVGENMPRLVLAAALILWFRTGVWKAACRWPGPGDTNRGSRPSVLFPRCVQRGEGRKVSLGRHT